MTPENSYGKINLIPTTFHNKNDFFSMLRYTNIERKLSFPTIQKTVPGIEKSKHKQFHSIPEESSNHFHFEINVSDMFKDREKLEKLTEIEENIAMIDNKLDGIKISKVSLLDYGHIDGYSLKTLLYKVMI